MYIRQSSSINMQAPSFSKEEYMNVIDDNIMEVRSESSMDDSDTLSEKSQVVNKSASSRKNFPGYIKYYTLKKNKKIKIECFSTSCNPGSYILCPYSGIKSNDRVGSKDEGHYFKARMCSISTGNEPITLYYDSPEAFEKHHLVTLSNDIKESWKNKRKNL